MIREKITDPWKEVSWDEAISFADNPLKKFKISMVKILLEE